MNTSLTRPLRRLRSMSPFWTSPIDRFFRTDLPDLLTGEMAETIPSLNVTENKNNYLIELAAPGLKKEDFNINVEGNHLTISCDKEKETKEEDQGYYRREYNYSSFSRTVTLPEYADSDKISAKYTDGILSLSIPKKPEAQMAETHKIKVQ